MKSTIGVVLVVAIATGGICLIVYGAFNMIAQSESKATASSGAESLQIRIATLEQQIKELRWDMDDLRLRNRSPDELAEALKAGKDHPESTVVVSQDYPKWRLPYGVYIDDQRPPEVLADDIEQCKAGKGTAYMWLALPTKEAGKELRVYFTKVGYKEPKP